MIGSATNKPLTMNGSNEPSRITLIASNGSQPTGEVFLIMKANEISDVKMTVLSENLFF
jgi:hypothetical protein